VPTQIYFPDPERSATYETQLLQMKWPKLFCLILSSLLLVSCGGGSSDSSLSTNTASPGTAPPQPVLRAVEAFPGLDFSALTVVTHANDGSDRLFVAELGGVIRVFQNTPSAAQSQVFLDLSSLVVTNGERGLLGLAFHPQFLTNGFFYVYYSAPPATGGQDNLSVVSRFQVSADPNVADPNSELRLLTFDQPFSNHNGGCLVFGPDGKLYISSGDGGGNGDPAGNGQSLTTLLGKILRLNPDGSIPSDNPFVGMGAGVREEIWAYGFRNPWRISFDPSTGLWAGDVGERSIEEIDLVTRGGNYGWSLFEGLQDFNNPGQMPIETTEQPVLTYDRDLGASVTGGVVYRGTALPELSGRYIYGDFVSGRVWALTFDGQQVTENEELFEVPGNTSFGTDQAGEVLICTIGGALLRIER
jgi:glucose/arabinose dehydrogenase